jgi:DNA processing protein
MRPRVNLGPPSCYGNSATQKKGVELKNPCYLSREEVVPLRPALAQTRFMGLYAAGSLEALAAPAVAIVGSRAPSEAGRGLARRVAAELARAGVCVVSGLALGIDGAAHLGALDAHAPTIGVLGGGHRRFHPRHNLALAERMIVTGGAVVSPFPPDTPARPHQFIQRNAIIAALADAVVVVEAAKRSGSLNTAGWAGDLGIPVFAFPGDVDRPKVAGCLAMLRDGATLARDANDILEGIGLNGACRELPRPATIDAMLTPLETALLRRLREGEAIFDELAQAHPGKMPEVIASLSRLELRGILERRAGGAFARARDHAGTALSRGEGRSP